MAAATYCSVRDVKDALDVKATAYSDRRILRAIESSSRSADDLTHRKFWPQTDTRYFDWPGPGPGRAWVLWLEQHEVISVTTLSSGGTTITASQYNLEPNGDGPPYDRIELDLSASAAFGGGSTPQRDITLTGVYGYGADTVVAAAAAEALDASETGVDVTDSSLLAAGDAVLVDSEYMTISSTSMLDTGVDIDTGGALTASISDVTLACDTTTGIPQPGEVILIDSERMLVVDLAGATLTVKRAFDGTTLAAHSEAASIYAPRTLNVTRGAWGTTAATHDNACVIHKHTPPALVRDLVIAEAIVRFEQESAGYARTVGGGENARNASLAGLQDLRETTYTNLGRKLRHRAV